MGNLLSSCFKSSSVPTPGPTSALTPAPLISQTQNNISAESSEKIDYRVLDAAAFVAAGNSVIEEIGAAFARVQHNREQCQLLRDRSEEVFKAINENWKPEDELTLAPAVNKFIALLAEIRTSMETYASYTHFDSFIYQFNIADDVEAKLKHLDHTLARFELATTAITQDLAAARETDFGDLGEALRGQARLKNTTRENRVALDRVLGGLQTLLRQQAPGPAQEQTKSRIFIIQSVINVGLPETKLLSGIECQKTGSEPVVGTNAYEIWQGLWMGRQKVALKVLRQSNFDELESGKSRKRLMRWERRIDVWSKLHNEYILPLYGICYDDGPFPYLVSPWCPNGDANRYLKDKSAAERLKICLDAARGLQYLHSLEQPVIYGTMSGGGILISNDGRALLADFGVPSATDILSPGDGRAGNSPSQIYRWMAPEMQSSTNTKSTDIWSWGMTTVELVSGKQPFPSFRMPGTILLKIAQGERPNPKEHDPAVLRGELWSLLQSCWHKDPEERPNIDVVVKKMEAIVDAYRRA